MQEATSLQARRIALGWSIDQLARFVDRDVATVEAWERIDAPERARW
jgi:transcriptional regulator with XRE-family HTH domain